MKKFILAFSFSIVTSTSFAAPPTHCTVLKELAEVTMSARQSGANRAALERVAIEKGLPVALALIKQAYAAPIGQTDRQKEAIVNKFAQDMQNLCIAHSPQTV